VTGIARVFIVYQDTFVEKVDKQSDEERDQSNKCIEALILNNVAKPWMHRIQSNKERVLEREKKKHTMNNTAIGGNIGTRGATKGEIKELRKTQEETKSRQESDEK
jgi:hypothetical protein